MTTVIDIIPLTLPLSFFLFTHTSTPPFTPPLHYRISPLPTYQPYPNFFVVTTIGGTYSVGDDMPYAMDTSYNFPNLLQIWCISSVPVASVSTSASASVSTSVPATGIHGGGGEGGSGTERWNHPIIINAPSSSSSSSSSSSFGHSSTRGVGHSTPRYETKATLVYCIGMHRYCTHYLLHHDTHCFSSFFFLHTPLLILLSSFYFLYSPFLVQPVFHSHEFCVMTIGTVQRTSLESIMEHLAPLSLDRRRSIVVGVVGSGMWRWVLCGDVVASWK